MPFSLRDVGMLDEARSLLLRVTELSKATDAASAIELLGDLARKRGHSSEAAPAFVERRPSGTRDGDNHSAVARVVGWAGRAGLGGIRTPAGAMRDDPVAVGP